MKAAVALALVGLAAQAQERTLTVPGKPLDAFFSRDGASIAVRCDGDLLHVYDLSAGKERATIGPLPKGTWLVRWSGDGRRLATAGDHAEAAIWDASNGSLVKKHPVRGHAYALAVSTDGTSLAVGDAESEVALWDGTGEKRLAHVGEAQDLAFSPDGSLLSSAGSDALVRVFRVSDGGLLKTLDDAVHSQFALSFSPDGTRLATAGADGSVRLYETAGWRSVARTLSGRMPGVFVSVDGAGRVFAVFAPVGPGPRPSWLRWNPADGKEERGDLPGTTPPLGGSSDGSLVAFPAGDGKVSVVPLKR